jgi:hypothetical protein
MSDPPPALDPQHYGYASVVKLEAQFLVDGTAARIGDI